MNERVKKLMEGLRARIESDHHETQPMADEYYFEAIDRFLASPDNSDLEKAFFLRK